MLILMAGLPGTGKSTLARALAADLGGTILNKDEIRAALFTPRDVEYSSEQDEFCMRVMLKVAGYLFRKDPGRKVFLDGRTFSPLSTGSCNRIRASPWPAVAHPRMRLQ
jgi:predicted kinase